MSSDPMREALSNALTENGISEGVDGLHGWRCAHPDRYGPCTCVAELLDDLAAALAPLIEARVREARAEALTDASDAWTQGAWASTPRHKDRVADRMAASQYAGDWLRERAEEVRRG